MKVRVELEAGVEVSMQVGIGVEMGWGFLFVPSLGAFYAKHGASLSPRAWEKNRFFPAFFS